MKRAFVTTLVILAAMFHISALGQDANVSAGEDETCAEPVYERKEVTRPAKIKLPEVELTDEARAKYLKGTLVITFVLCRTGRVTDIVVAKSLPYGMTERVVEALRRTKFTPAEKGGQEVSQKLRAEFTFHMY